MGGRGAGSGAPRTRRCRAAALLVVFALAAGCDAAAPPTPPITPGTVSAPRELNVIAKDYTFVPAVVDLVPGEIVVLHVVNGGEVIHEAVFGGAATQAAWEVAEAAAANEPLGPPGPTPVVTVAPGVEGLRVVAASGARTDVTWTVPADGPATPGFVVGCHIPGHLAQGMVVPVRWIGRDGRPLEASAPAAAGS